MASADTTGVTHPRPFIRPPRDETTFFPDWADFHLHNNADAIYTVLVDTDSNSGEEENVLITWGEFARAAIRLAAQLREQVKPPTSEEERREGVRIAILANTDSLTYCTLILAIIRAGFIAFPISTRNSVPALEHLLRETKTSYLIGSVPQQGGKPSTALEQTTSQLLALLPDVHLLPLPRYTTLYPRLLSRPPPPYDPPTDALLTPPLPPVRAFPEYEHVTPLSPIIYLHSSGSTNFPKPIPRSHRFWRASCEYMGAVERIGSRWSVMGLPAFHAMGVFTGLAMPASWGTIAVAFRPSEPPIVPSPERVLQGVKRGDAEWIISVPSFFEEWAHDDDAVKYLATRKALIYAGGPLAKEAGDKLSQAGGKIIVAYGTTEVGPVFRLAPRDDPEDWNYGEFFPTAKVELVPEGDNIYRLIILDSDLHPIDVWNLPDRKGFDTNDLLERHPTKKNLWKVVGRADDQIMMSNGEKTNPGPMENIIAGNAHVKACMMFGRGRTQVGIAIEPAEHIKITSDEELAAFRNLIWPDVENANAFAPQHSRIFKEFILVIDPRKKGFAKTPKGTVSKNASLKLFEEEINALYEAAEQPTKAGWAAPPSAWDEEGIHAFVARVVNGVMRGENSQGSPIDEDRHLFEQGCDSLQATYIRASITGALRHAPNSQGKANMAASVPHNLVFMHPTIRRLVTYVTTLVSGASGSKVGNAMQRPAVVDEMLAMVKKYTAEFALHHPVDRHAIKEVVLLTGTTGTLGTYLLQTLLLDEHVEQVYAVNRINPKHALLDRQREAFEDRGVDLALLDSPKLRLVESDLADDKLGLSDELYAEISASLTTIIHNAWRLDFNLSLPSFEPNIRSSRLLIDLALRVKSSTPAKFIFISSIGTLVKRASPTPTPEVPIADPNIASATGYTQSKWITEQIALAAAEKRGLSATIWRVGQLAGSVANGAWNVTDWVPLVVKSAETLGVLPSLRGTVSWLPTDRAAQSIVDALHSNSESGTGTAEYLHLVHPRPTAWDKIFSPLAQLTNSTLVPYDQWLTALSQAAEDPANISKNPAIKLLEFFRATGAAAARKAAVRSSSSSGGGVDDEGEEEEDAVFGDLETTNAQGRSRTLRELEPLGEEDVRRWVGYWRAKGFLA